MDINLDLVQKFRRYTNSNESILLKIFENVEGNKNHWTLIHSCLDWIKVAVSFITTNWNIDGDHPKKCMHLYSLISAADLILESITQLNRVLNGSQSKRPFDGEKKIFEKGEFSHLDDNAFFKEIRAVFGSHPVNLKKAQNGAKKEIYFSSWSFEVENNKFSAILYPLCNNLHEIHFNLDVLELKQFIQNRYNHLNILLKDMEMMVEKYIAKYIQSKIKFDESVSNLNLLKKESVERFDHHYINNLIDSLIRVFNSNTGIQSIDQEEKNYKGELKKLIREIHRNLQKMSLENLEYDYLLDPLCPNEISYCVEKVLISIYNSQKDLMFDNCINEINSFSNNKYKINPSEDMNVIFLKLHLLFYSYRNNELFS